MEKKIEKRHYSGFSGWGSGPDDEDWNTVARNFKINLGPEPKYVFAAYETPPYEGYAFILYKEGRKWFYVRGSHCSCYGLEDQWSPDEVDPKLHLKALKLGRTLIDFYCYDNPDLQKQFNEWIAHWVGK